MLEYSQTKAQKCIRFLEGVPFDELNKCLEKNYFSVGILALNLAEKSPNYSLETRPIPCESRTFLICAPVEQTSPWTYKNLLLSVLSGHAPQQIKKFVCNTYFALASRWKFWRKWRTKCWSIENAASSALTNSSYKQVQRLPPPMMVFSFGETSIVGCEQSS